MIKFDYKKLLGWQNILLLVIFIISLVGFSIFETSIIVKILLVVTVAALAIIYFKTDKFEYLTLAIFFLSVYDFYNLYFFFGWPLWLAMLLVALISALMIYLLFKNNVENIDANFVFMYLSLSALLSLEIFLVLIPWPVDPKSKSIILLSIFYLFYHVVILKNQNELNFKKINPYLIVVGLLVTVVVLTSQWYGY